MNQIELYTTNDGSHTLYLPHLDETYHSRNGAIEESLYVFIDKGLNTFLSQNPEIKTVQIFEVGFGTGLNAMLTFIAAQKLNLNVVYHSIEAFPLPIEITNQLNYINGLTEQEQTVFKKMHLAEWNKPIAINNQFTLSKYHDKLESFDNNGLLNNIHIIYMDAFAPNKQAELWEITIFEKLYQLLATNGILVTYTSKGDVKRAMQQVGLTVEKLDGPPRKRHMLRGKKLIANSRLTMVNNAIL
jgi:tRNA U34 5-methylaminomethyl-2-thiouridine-forming methyltransferase MnmC